MKSSSQHGDYEQLHSQTHNQPQWSSGSQDTLSSKFEKIRRMSKPYYSTDNIESIIEYLDRWVLVDSGNHKVVDDFLTELSQKISEIDTNYSLSSKRSTTSTEIYPQRIQQQSVIKNYGDLDAATKTKLLEIEHLMTACFPIDYVIREIPALLKRYEISGDLSSLNEAVDRLRHKAEMYMKRYMYR